MIEKYIEYRMFMEFKLPLIILGIGLALALLLIVCGYISYKWEQRQKKQIDKYFKYEKNDESDIEVK